MRSIRRAFLLCLGVLLSRALAGDFETANQLYDEGRFDEARRHYHALIERGEWSANLFYNLGNADYRANAPGRAVLNYERALALQQSHIEAPANLKWLREQTAARVFQRKWLDYMFPLLSINVFAWLAAAAAWLTILAAAARLLRFSGRRWLELAVISFLLAAYAATAVWSREQDADLAIVTAAAEVQARLAPADRAVLAGVLPPGSQVKVLSYHGDWVYCVLPGETRGWLPTPTIEKVRFPQPAQS